MEGGERCRKGGSSEDCNGVWVVGSSKSSCKENGQAGGQTTSGTEKLMRS